MIMKDDKKTLEEIEVYADELGILRINKIFN